MRVPPCPPVLALALAGAVLTGSALCSVTTAPPASAATPPVGLGTAGAYAVLAGTAVTNTGPSVVSGDLGVAPGLAVTGFPPGDLQGARRAGAAAAGGAQADLTTAYVDAAGRGEDSDLTGVDLGGLRLEPGVHAASTSMSLTGTVTLDALGDPDAIFVLKAGSSLLTASGSSVSLVGAASPCNVFWQVGSSATIGTSTRFVGTILALSSATLQTGASLQGRVLARNGQVSLDTNTITRPSCATGPTTVPSTGPTPTAAPVSPAATATAGPSSKPSSKPSSTPGSKQSTRPSGKPSGPASTRPPARATGTPATPGGPRSTSSSGLDTGTRGGTGTTGTTGTGTVVPSGHPGTGRSPAAAARVAPGPLPLGLVAGLALLGLALLGGGVLARARTDRSR